MPTASSWTLGELKSEMAIVISSRCLCVADGEKMTLCLKSNGVALEVDCPSRRTLYLS